MPFDAGRNVEITVQRRNPFPCETPGCSENCTYAYSCHEQRMGRNPVVFWPAVGLILLLAAAAIF
ncbi:MAG TPA: hypothetical protein VGA19_09440 [Rhodospirillales bacterium]|jgi:hypothetical protein